MPIVTPIDSDNVFWKTPQGLCTYCKDNHNILPLAIKDYQDMFEYRFCSWKCLTNHINEISWENESR
jgi:hypothetical protein